MMRILCLTNFYPPYEIGGEEQSCYDVVHALKSRGHTVAVLTSTHGPKKSQDRKPEKGVVYRELHLEMELGSPLHPLRFFLTRKQRERQSLSLFKKRFQEFKPDVIFIWGMWNLPRTLPALAESLQPGRVLYRFGDYWPTLPSQHVFYWRTPGQRRITRPLKRLLSQLALTQLNRDESPPQLRFEHAYCISAAVRQELVEKGVKVEHARIIYNGVDTELFHPRLGTDVRQNDNNKLSLLYAGRIVRDKGVHTAIEAISHLVNQVKVHNITLTLVGHRDFQYYAELQEFVKQHALHSYVSFLDPVPKDEMPRLLRDFDVLLFPSVWPEPFGRILIEAMASGLAVISTPVGGVPEIVTEGQDGLFFPPEDAQALASQIYRLYQEPSLRYSLAQTARHTVKQRFALSVMMDQVEAFLAEVAYGDPLRA